MNTYNYAFPRRLGSGDDPVIGLIECANNRHPGFIEWVIDGGAGVGSFTDRVLKESAGCKVIAYEPLPENVQVLRSRFDGIPSVNIREAALGDRSTSVSFEVPERKGIPNSLWAPGTSYAGYVSKSGILPRIKGIAKKILRPANSETISVAMVRLDSELDVSPDFIKLDLQGGEPEALNGLGRFLAQTKVVKVEIQMLGGDSRSRCVRALKNAGFFLYVEGLQFAVPQMTARLRRTLADNGIKIELERRIHRTDSEVVAVGSWPTERPLPIQNMKLTQGFASELLASKASYFQVDLIALNGLYSQQWNSILPPELRKQSEMKPDGK